MQQKPRLSVFKLEWKLSHTSGDVRKLDDRNKMTDFGLHPKR